MDGENVDNINLRPINVRKKMPHDRSETLFDCLALFLRHTVTSHNTRGLNPRSVCYDYPGAS